MTLLKSSKVRFSKRGAKYLNVPMRKTKRTIIAHGGGAAYAAAARLQASVRTGGATRWGGRLPDPSRLASRIHSRARHVAGIGHVPAHKTDPLASMYKFRVRGSRGHKYGIFRTISATGKPWVHPGMKARRFIRKVAKMLPDLASRVL